MKLLLNTLFIFLLPTTLFAKEYRSENAFAYFHDNPYWRMANEVDYLAYPELLRSSTRKNFEAAYVKRAEHSQNYVIVEVIKDRQFAQWHLQMIKKSKKSFQKFFNKSFKREDLKVEKFEYDESTHRLELSLKSEGLNIFSFLKITDYGCIAFHYVQNDTAIAPVELIAFKSLVYKMKLDPNKVFIPEPWWISLRKGAGSVIFLFMLLGIYVFLRLKNKKQSLKQRQLNRIKQRVEARLL